MMANIIFILSALIVFSGFEFASCGHCENCHKREVHEDPSQGHCSADSSKNLPLQLVFRKYPDPFVLVKGEKFNVSATIKVSQKLPKRFVLSLSLWKKIGFWMKILCMSNVGSCDYKFDCEKMNCTQFLDMCSNCKIAVDDLTLTIPMNINFPSFLVNGKYWAGYKIFDGDNGSPVACGEHYFRIEI